MLRKDNKNNSIVWIGAPIHSISNLFQLSELTYIYEFKKVQEKKLVLPQEMLKKPQK